MIRTLRAVYRFFAFIVLTSIYLLPMMIHALFRKDEMGYILKMRMRWAHRCIPALGVRMDVSEPPRSGGPYIFIGNHRSYFDPIAVLHYVPVMPVAKAEVGRWPFIGFAARVSGVLFVKRESAQSRRNALEGIEHMLQKGHSILIYPEGTTHIDPQVRAFRPGAFRVAARLGVPVVPLAIEYSRWSDAWIGKDTFLPHFYRTFGRKRIYLKMRFGEPVMSDDPRVLLETSQSWINEQMAGLQGEFGLSDATLNPNH